MAKVVPRLESNIKLTSEHNSGKISLLVISFFDIRMMVKNNVIEIIFKSYFRVTAKNTAN